MAEISDLHLACLNVSRCREKVLELTQQEVATLLGGKHDTVSKAESCYRAGVENPNLLQNYASDLLQAILDAGRLDELYASEQFKIGRKAKGKPLTFSNHILKKARGIILYVLADLADARALIDLNYPEISVEATDLLASYQDDAQMRILAHLGQLSATKSHIQVILDGNHLLPKLTEHNRNEAFKLIGKASECVLNGGDGLKLSQLTHSYAGDILPLGSLKDKLNTELWWDEQESLAELMVPATAKLRKLSFPPPYSKEWIFTGSKWFKRLYCLKSKDDPFDAGTLDIDTFKRQPSEVQTTPGAPAHQFYGNSAFLIDRRRDALETLHRAQIDYRSSPRHKDISPRLTTVAPHLLVLLMKAGRIKYNAPVAATDVATTHLNPHVTIFPETYVRALVGTLAVGIDCYDKQGRRSHDGLAPISDEDKWSLVRTNHAIKAIRISVLLITSDMQAVFALRESHTLFGPRAWSPTYTFFADPNRFMAKSGTEPAGNLVTAVVESAKDTMRRDFPTKEIKVSVCGFALDACGGLQPYYFCTAYCEDLSYDAVTESLRDEAVCREYPLVDDNPAVSLGEAYGRQARHAGCDLLQTSLFFAWRWFTVLGDSNGPKNPMETIGENGSIFMARLHPQASTILTDRAVTLSQKPEEAVLD